VDEGRLAPAAEVYRDIIGNRRLESLWPVAKLRLARLLEAQGEYDNGLSLLDETPPTGFEAAWSETRGDLLFQAGRTGQAREAWQEALAKRTADGGNARLLQIKIDAAAVDGDPS
jgi:predicted negative regulator of RcsB-dependent stress response